MQVILQFHCIMKLWKEHNCSSRVSKTCHLHCSSLFQRRNRPATLQTADSWQMARRSLNRTAHEKLQKSTAAPFSYEGVGRDKVGRWKNKNKFTSPDRLQMNPSTLEQSAGYCCRPWGRYHDCAAESLSGVKEQHISTYVSQRVIPSFFIKSLCHWLSNR